MYYEYNYKESLLNGMEFIVGSKFEFCLYCK